MRRISISAAVASIALMALPNVGQAQVATVLKPIRVGIAAGASVPVSDLGNAYSTGYNVTGVLAFNPLALPVGFRADAAYNSFSAKGSGSTTAKIASVTGNVLYSLGAGIAATPYLIGGAGWYRESTNIVGSNSTNHVGFNVGAGINLPLTGFSTFIEARYNHVSESNGSTAFIPITVGVLF